MATKPKLPVEGQKIGVNVIVTFTPQNKGDKAETYSRKATKEEWELISKRLAIYNKKPSPTGRKVIIGMMTPEKVKKEKEKEDLVAKTKGLKQQVKKVAKASGKGEVVAKVEKKSLLDELETLIKGDASGESVKEIQSLINKFKRVEEKTAPAQQSAYRRPGEH